MYSLLEFLNSSLYSKLNIYIYIYIASVFVITLPIKCALYMVAMDFESNVLHKKAMQLVVLQ